MTKRFSKLIVCRNNLLFFVDEKNSFKNTKGTKRKQKQNKTKKKEVKTKIENKKGSEAASKRIISCKERGGWETYVAGTIFE